MKLSLLVIFFFICTSVFSSPDVINPLIAKNISQFLQSDSLPVILFPESNNPDLQKLNLLFQKGFYKTPEIVKLKELPSHYKVQFNEFYIKGLSLENSTLIVDKNFVDWKYSCSIKCSVLSELIQLELKKLGMLFPKFQANNNFIYASGYLKFLYFNINIKTKGSIEFSTDKFSAFIKLVSLKMGSVPSPSFIRGKIMKQFNPFLGLNKTHKIQWNFHHLELKNNLIYLELKGKTKN